MNSGASRLAGFFSKYDSRIFSVLIFLHLLPVICFKFHPTVDGPSHLYNSNIINDLLFNQGGVFGSFFTLNPAIEPNWSGHFILCLLNFILPAFLAEKIMLIAYFVAFPLAFRYLMKQLAGDKTWSTYLIFPFIYSFTFLLGFFNFCLSIPLLFLVVGYWVKYRNRLSLKRMLALAMLFLLIYFSHLLIFLLAGGIMGLISLKSDGIKSVFRNLLNICFVAFPGLILTSLFIFNKYGTPEDITSTLPFSRLFEWLISASPLITFNPDVEKGFTSWIFYSFFALFLFGFSRRTVAFLKDRSFLSDDLWLLIAGILLVLYFFVPDELFTGGFVSIRLLLLFYLFFLVWAGTQQFPASMRFLVICTALFVSLHLVDYHLKEISQLNGVASAYYEMGDHIPENSVVLPLSYSENWLHSNFNNYIGSDKKIIVLDNYEAATPHFPTRWIKSKMPYALIGNFAGSNRPCAEIENYQQTTSLSIDYVVRWLYIPSIDDSCTRLLNSQLEQNYEILYKSPDQPLELFIRKGLKQVF